VIEECIDWFVCFYQNIETKNTE